MRDGEKSECWQGPH